MAYQPIAIIGYGCSFPPDGKNTEKFFENVLSNKSGILDMPKIYWNSELYYDTDRKAEDKTYCKLGGIIPNYQFPYELAEKLGLSKEVLKPFNRTELMTLDTILQAVSCSEKELKDYSNEAIGFYLGNMLGDAGLPNYVLKSRVEEVMAYLEQSPDFMKFSLEDRQQIKAHVLQELNQRLEGQGEGARSHLYQSSLLKSIQQLLDIQGVQVMVDGACSGSVLVIDEAIKNIHSGKMHTCITSAVLGNMIVTGNVAFAKVGGLTATGTYPLDHRTGGLVSGEGAGTLILKDLKKAMEDQDKIFGVIRSSGVASDGKGQSIYAPSTKGQLGSMEKSLERADLKPEDIDYIETHATGTLVGDKVELNTLMTLFGEVGETKKIAIGSIKSQIGHAFSAAGMANIMKVMEGMRRQIMPPTHNFEKLPEGVDFKGTPLYVNTEVKPWDRKDDRTPRRAMVNAFGFGGINANLILEEYHETYHKMLVQENTDSKLPMDISIVGMGALDFMAENKDVWWEKVLKGVDEPIHVPADRWNETVKELFEETTGYFLQKINFPCIRFKIPPATLKQIDRSQQVALMASYEAVNDYGLDKIPEERSGVFVGSMLGLESALLTDLRIRLVEYLDILKKMPLFKTLSETHQEMLLEHITTSIRGYIAKVEEDTLPGYMDNIIAGRISNFFNVRGTNAVYDSDALSFMSALDQGVLSLISKENDLIIVGGIHANLMPEWIELFNEYKKDPERLATVKKLQLEEAEAAEGAVFFVLKRTEDVTADEKVYGKLTDLRTIRPENVKDRTGLNRCAKSGKRPFYFGAEEGFNMLHHLLTLNESTNEKDVKIQQSLSLYGDSGYEIKLCHRNYVPVNETPAEIQREEATSSYVKYYVGQNEEDLFNALVENRESAYDEGFMEAKHRLAIVYTTEIELERKKKLVQANLIKRG